MERSSEGLLNRYQGADAVAVEDVRHSDVTHLPGCYNNSAHHHHQHYHNSAVRQRHIKVA